MKAVLVAILLSLAGCSSWSFTPQSYEKIVKTCEINGGVDYTTVDDAVLIGVCKNGVTFKVSKNS